MQNEQLVLDNLNLAYFFAKKFRHQKDFDDIAQTAVIGLIKAARTYNETKNYKFSTYASKCINNEILMYFRKEKKHQRLNCVSLDDIIYDDAGNLLVIGDTVADTRGSSNPELTVENLIELEKALQIILNLEHKKATIMIKVLAGRPRKEIALEYGYASVAMISRTVKFARDRIKLGIIHQDKYDVEISGRQISVINLETQRETSISLDSNLYENLLKIM